MGYRIRVFALNDGIISISELRQLIEVENLPVELILEERQGDEGWEAIIIRHLEGADVAFIERNQVIAGELGAAEIAEFISELEYYEPQSASRWLAVYLLKVQTIYSIQILGGADRPGGWKAVHAIQSAIRDSQGGLLQADGEGFSNESGDLILWQFSDSPKGNWRMALLDEEGKWIRFRMEIDDPAQRAAFMRGEVPAGVQVF